MKKIFGLRYWITLVFAVMVFVPFMAYQQHRASDKYKDHRAGYCTTHFATAKEQESCIEKSTHADDYLPWWYELFSWPGGITTWAIIGTGFVIAWQSIETRRAAVAAQKSVDMAIAANTQWTKLELLDMYSYTSKSHTKIPDTLTLSCRWAIMNPSPSPLTLNRVAISVAREDAWDVSEFDFEEVVSPGERAIAIVAIALDESKTAEYLSCGVEFPVNIQIEFTGINGRIVPQSWGDLFYFSKGTVTHNPALGKGPQRETREEYEGESTIRVANGDFFDMPKIPYPRKKTKKRN